MIKNRKFWMTAALLAAVIATAPLTSCGGDDEPQIPGQGNTNNSGSNGGSTGGSSSADIKPYVNASCSYKDYYWHVSITSSLEAKYPGKQTTYSTGHAPYGNDEAYTVTHNGSSDGASYSQRSSGDVTYVEITEPFYYHFVAMASLNPSKKKEYNNILADCEAYLKTYRAVSAKSSLTAEERALLNDCVEALDEYERQARRESASIFVFAKVSNVDNTTLGNYRLP